MYKDFNVLYVEDEDEIKETVTNVISPLFNKLTTAANGQEGLDFYKENMDNIDLIITDINMPKMNGLEMSEAIRNISAEIPIIITTAHSDTEFLYKAISLGINHYVNKPMDMYKLVDAIKKSIEPIILKRDLARELKSNYDEKIKNAKFSSIAQMAAGMKHEINTPLTYIKANFEMLGYDIEDLPESNSKAQMLEDALKITNGIVRIENILLSMNEVSSVQDIPMDDINLYTTLLTSLKLSTNKTIHSKIYINDILVDDSIDAEAFNLSYKGQKSRIEQVWVILINNAMDELMKIDDFEARRFDIVISQDDSQIKFIFKDNAGGIAPDVIDRIFEPFKDTKSSSGMGIGLSIAKKVIDDHKAIIKAYNETNHAIFEVIFQKSN